MGGGGGGGVGGGQHLKDFLLQEQNSLNYVFYGEIWLIIPK